MTNAFSVLSLKRNRSASTSKAHSVGSSEPVSKLSRLKSGLNIFSKISDAITQHQQNNHQFHHYTKRTSFVGIFQYFRNDQDTKNKSCLRRKATYDSDGYYEYHQYHKKLNKKQKDAEQAERNLYTLPTAHNKKLTSILIKQSGTNSMNQQPQPQLQLQLNKISSRRSNTTQVSASNITIISEDLTAKEFADLAGIRILPEKEDTNDEQDYNGDLKNLAQLERKYSTSLDEDIHLHTVSTCSKSYMESLDEHSRLSVVSYVSLQSYSTSSKLRIWDNEFWLNPEEHYQRRVSRSNSTATHRSKTASSSEPSAKNLLDRKPSTIVVVEPPILHELRTRNSENKIDQNSHCVIKKGRFEIHLGDGNNSAVTTTATAAEPTCTLPTTTANNNATFTNTATNSINPNQQAITTKEGVLEWKRKRKE